MFTRSYGKVPKDPLFEANLRVQKQLVASVLEHVVKLEDSTFAHSLYRNLVSDSAIDGFLKKSRLYSLTQRRWKLPRSYSKILDNDTYAPMRNVIFSILKQFWPEEVAQGLRRVVDTHAARILHDVESPNHSSRPTISIVAQGPSFELPPPPTDRSSPADIGFSNIATCIDVQDEDEGMPIDEQLARAAIYARQLFIHQPNRRFARLLRVAGDHLRLFHFDRSGIQYTPPLNIHEDPHTFIRLVVGLSSTNEADIGLDTSIQWTIENGFKVKGTLMTLGADGTKTVYSLRQLDPEFSRPYLVCRGTTCWAVGDPATRQKFLVKDSWRLEEAASEGALLEEAVGVPGVVQMVSYEADRGQTRALRGFENGVPAKLDFENRIETRVVMKQYGKQIYKFSCAKRLICALRDAIAGHGRLFKKGVLHRDVAIQNILFGKAYAKEGERGFLIDLDSSTRCDADGFHPACDWTLGRPLYQSIMALYSEEIEFPLPHDHLDDLESFFYVFSHIINEYDCHGGLHKLSEEMKLWEDPRTFDLIACKKDFLCKSYPPESVIQRWPKAVLAIFYKMRKFLWGLLYEKLDLLEKEPKDRVRKLKWFMSRAEDDYEAVLEIFDEAIAKLEMGESESESEEEEEEVLSP
ncbi:hypothetical protein MD484_g8860, partial [Candolleomyces efflorescens]